MAENNAIETGTEYDNDADADADVFAFADDGEYATVWAVDRYADGEAHVKVFRCEAGLIGYDDGEAWTIRDSDKSTEEFARELAEEDPEGAVEAAREYWI